MNRTMTKAARVVVKAVGPGPGEEYNDTGLGPGEFAALVSVFGNVDTYGDVVMEGAFADVLSDYRERGVPIPILWSHDWADPYSHIGHADPDDVEETPEGLMVRRGVLDIDSPIPAAAAKAQQVHRLLEQRRVTQFSFAFDVADAGWGVRGEGDNTREVFELRKFGALHEVGPCLVGVNQDTRLEDVKALRASYPKPGRKADPAPIDSPTPPPGDGGNDDAGDAPDVKSLDPRSAALLADIAALG